MAEAAEPICDGEMCATEVREGRPAPFTGQLMTLDLAISLGQKAGACDAVTEREVNFTRRIERLDVERVQKLHALDNDANAKRHMILLDQLKKERAWWRQPAVVAAVTAVITVGMVVATGYALQGVAQ